MENLKERALRSVGQYYYAVVDNLNKQGMGYAIIRDSDCGVCFETLFKTKESAVRNVEKMNKGDIKTIRRCSKICNLDDISGVEWFILVVTNKDLQEYHLRATTNY